MKKSNQPKHIAKVIAEWLLENPQLSTATVALPKSINTSTLHSSKTA